MEFKVNSIKNLMKNCKYCGSIGEQMHHEIYPLTVQEIKKAIKENKIYYVCLKCHKDLIVTTPELF